MPFHHEVLIGYSGHGIVVADAALQSGHHLKFYLDKEEKALNPFRLQYLGLESDQNLKAWGQGFGYILGIGNNTARKSIASLLKLRGEKIATVIHPKATFSSLAHIGEGTFINAGAVVHALAFIGMGVIANTGTIIEHECQIGDFSHLAPGVVLAGSVVIGKGSFIGANSVVKEGVTIGDNVVIGAGSVVIRNISSGSKVAGNPTQPI